MTGTVHVVGAGLAGLSAAVELASRGDRVTLHEAAPQAGGRCRSYFDAELGCRIDNGNHLLLAANRAALDYLGKIGARDTLTGPGRALFDWMDLGTGERWRLEPGPGKIPWWMLQPRRRVPGTRLAEYLAVLRLARADGAATIAGTLDPRGTLYRRLWQPFAVAALNTEMETASARLLWAVLQESFGAGGKALEPLVPREGLSESFVDPALAFLAGRGGAVRFGTRLRAIDLAGDRATALRFDDLEVPLGPADRVVLAVPAPVAQRLLPGIAAPDDFQAIVNAHYCHEAGPGTPLLVGLVGGTAEWVFRKPGILSVTVSAADRLVDLPAAELAGVLWKDVAQAYDLPHKTPPKWRIVKEKRATFAATPAQLGKRPGAATSWRNLALAGDWTDTGLPSTIEGAIRSGVRAAGIWSNSDQNR